LDVISRRRDRGPVRKNDDPFLDSIKTSQVIGAQAKNRKDSDMRTNGQKKRRENGVIVYYAY
jgi:hypothetical protein